METMTHDENMSKSFFITRLLHQQINVVRDFFTLFLLVIGINLLIHGVDGFLCIAGFRTELLYLIVGIIILLVYIIYYFINRLKSEVYNESIESPVFVIDKKIISVKGYKSSEDMVTYMNYASVESKNIDDVSKIKDFSNWKNSFEKIVHELVEYILLLYMDYSNNENYCSTSMKLVEIDRNSLTDFVANNRFFSLFTEPTENRSAFNNKRIGKHTVSAISNGACYEKLTIKLPEKCILSRMKNGIKLDSNMFLLEINYDFDERLCCKVLSGYFGKYYMKRSDYCITPSTLSINIKFNPKFKSLFIKKLEWYTWVEVYINRVIDAFSFDRFSNSINWNLLEANLYINEKKKKKNSKIKSKQRK